MAAPTKFPRWATNNVANPTSGENNVTEPSEAKKDLGWDFKEFPPRQYFNWLGRIANDWLVWFDSLLDQEVKTISDVGFNSVSAAATVAGSLGDFNSLEVGAGAAFAVSVAGNVTAVADIDSVSGNWTTGGTIQGSSIVGTSGVFGTSAAFGAGLTEFIVNTGGDLTSQGSLSVASGNFTVDGSGNATSSATIAGSLGAFVTLEVGSLAQFSVDASGNLAIEGTITSASTAQFLGLSVSGTINTSILEASSISGGATGQFQVGVSGNISTSGTIASGNIASSGIISAITTKLLTSGTGENLALGFSKVAGTIPFGVYVYDSVEAVSMIGNQSIVTITAPSTSLPQIRILAVLCNTDTALVTGAGASRLGIGNSTVNGDIGHGDGNHCFGLYAITSQNAKSSVMYYSVNETPFTQSMELKFYALDASNDYVSGGTISGSVRVRILYERVDDLADA